MGRIEGLGEEGRQLGIGAQGLHLALPRRDADADGSRGDGELEEGLDAVVGLQLPAVFAAVVLPVQLEARGGLEDALVQGEAGPQRRGYGGCVGGGILGKEIVVVHGRQYSAKAIPDDIGGRAYGIPPSRSARAAARVPFVHETIHLAAFNAENFYLLIDPGLGRAELEALSEADYLAMNTSIFNPNKQRGKVAEIARIILERDFDLVCLCEVGGMETLAAFNRLYLEGRYDFVIHEENSRRGIFVGALLKKGRFPGARARAMHGSFSRNLLALDLGPEGGDLEVFALHLKAQAGEDWGLEQRIWEVERLAALARPRNSVVLGDFNGILIRGEQQFEYEPFLELPFADVLEIVGVPVERRRTHYYFGPAPNFAQLDYIFCTPDIEVLEAGVIEGEIPINRAQRSRLPSDHLFIQATLRPARPITPIRSFLSDILRRRIG
jgi:endonuclease/exonuclease/phosphatase family metal-dependent hydrolase